MRLLGAKAHTARLVTQTDDETGQAVESYGAPIDVVGSIQPMDASEKADLQSSGRRIAMAYHFYTQPSETELRVAGSDEPGYHEVQVRGHWLHVHEVDDYDTDAIPGIAIHHRHYVLVGGAP